MARFTTNGDYLRTTKMIDDPSYWGADRYEDLVWRECHYSGKEGKEQGSFQGKAQHQCPICYIVVPESFLKDGKLPLHERPINVYEQAEEIITDVAKRLGFEEWGDVALTARSAGTDRDLRTHSVDKMVAIGLAHLQVALVTRGAAEEAGREIAKLTDFKCDQHEHPFFTEATLYDLLGKEDARTVLAYVHAAQRATASD
jgi:hypothetical protein